MARPDSFSALHLLSAGATWSNFQMRTPGPVSVRVGDPPGRLEPVTGLCGSEPARGPIPLLLEPHIGAWVTPFVRCRWCTGVAHTTLGAAAGACEVRTRRSVERTARYCFLATVLRLLCAFCSCSVELGQRQKEPIPSALRRGVRSPPLVVLCDTPSSCFLATSSSWCACSPAAGNMFLLDQSSCI